MPVWDHPRVSGEHVKMPGKTAAYLGSSPRERGALKNCKN